MDNILDGLQDDRKEFKLKVLRDAYRQADAREIKAQDAATLLPHLLDALRHSSDSCCEAAALVLRIMLSSGLLRQLAQLSGVATALEAQLVKKLAGKGCPQVEEPGRQVLEAADPGAASRQHGGNVNPAAGERSEEVRQELLHAAAAMARAAFNPMATGSTGAGEDWCSMQQALACTAVSIVSACAQDAAPMCKEAALRLFLLVHELGGRATAEQLPCLACAFSEGLTSRQAKLRMLALQALDAVVSQGFTPSKLGDRALRTMVDMAMDKTKPVREQLFASIGRWVASTARQDTAVLLPTLLLGLTDADASIRTAVQLRLTPGQGGFVANQQQRKQAAGQESGSLHEGSSREEGGVAAAMHALQRQFVGQISGQMSSWKVPERLVAARQLQALVQVLGCCCNGGNGNGGGSDGSSLDQDAANQLVTEILRAVGDDDADVGRHGLLAAQQLGATHLPHVWMMPLSAAAASPDASHVSRFNALAALATALVAEGELPHHAAGSAWGEGDAALLASTVASCCQPGLVRVVGENAALVALAVAAAAARGTASQQQQQQQQRVAVRELLCAVLHVQGTLPEASIQEPCQGVLACLAAAGGRSSVKQLISDFAADIIDQLEQGDQGTGGGHGCTTPAGLCLLRQMTADCGPEALRHTVLPRCISTCGACIARSLGARDGKGHRWNLQGDAELEPDADGALHGMAEVMRLAGTLVNGKHAAEAFSEGDCAFQMVSKVLLPACEWRPGRAAAATRRIALDILHTMIRRKAVPPHVLQRLACGDGMWLMPHLLAACEDDSDVTGDGTRVMALRCISVLLEHAAPLPEHVLQQALQRVALLLDDPDSNSVRVEAALAIQAAHMWQHLAPNEVQLLNESISAHLMDEDEGVRSAVRKAWTGVLFNSEKSNQRVKTHVVAVPGGS